MIHSGAVFVFAVEESGIKRWTDGMLWSPSRIHKNFLVYREINERPQGRGSRRSFASEESATSRHRASPSPTEQLYSGFRNTALETTTFKLEGLHKKTITVTINDADWHLVAYYSAADMQSGLLKRPTARTDIMGPYMSPHVFRLTSFRIPPKIVMDSDGRPIVAADEEDDDEHVAGPFCKSEESYSQTSLFSPVLSPKNSFTGSSLYPISDHARISSPLPHRMAASSSTPDLWSRAPAAPSASHPSWSPDMSPPSGRWHAQGTSTQAYDSYASSSTFSGRPRSRTTGAPYQIPPLSSARGRQLAHDDPYGASRYPTPGPSTMRSASAGPSSLSWILDNPQIQRSPIAQHHSPASLHHSPPSLHPVPYSSRYSYQPASPIVNHPLQWSVHDANSLPLPRISSTPSLHSLASGPPPPFDMGEPLPSMRDHEEFFPEDN